ncbi:MAG TPA: PBP1A family penicillin-binding protein [bacterium]|nr:PBP1A family penicillin-binding protein [bacterium]HPN42079.1 PBP1A family penicillin-binding protein [bacterium]
MKRIFKKTTDNSPQPDSLKKPGKRIALLLLVLGIPIAALAGFYIYISANLPSSEVLEVTTPNLPSRVYSADGVLLKEFFTEKRVYKPLSAIPDMVKNAILATEDHRFFHHWGIVPSRFFKVTIAYLTTGSKQQGASTLTQQLARTLFLTREKTVIRKLKEAILSIKLERMYTKTELLEMYINHMSFGYGTYGIEAAAEKYFNKTVDQISVAECAVLIGVLQRPANINPEMYDKDQRYRDYVLERRNTVLSRMQENGFLSSEEYQQAVNSPIEFSREKDIISVDIAPYFTEEIRRTLYEEYGMSIYTSGMEIYSTLDSRVQACAEKAVRNWLPQIQKVVSNNMHKRKNFIRLVPPSMLRKRTIQQLMEDKALVDSLVNVKCAVQVGFIAIDPANGHILAMIGGRDFEESEFNRVTQAVRQPGSVFKPFVFTAAVDNGYMPYYEKLNQPIVVHMVDGTRWTPHNYDGSLGGLTTLREALKKSLNLVTARLVQEDVPPSQVIRYARNLGITTPLEAVDAIALGAIGVRPIEIISAFGVFANKGVLVEPNYLVRLEDKYNNILDKPHPQSKGVLREETAYIMASLLGSAATSGTGAAMRSVYQFYRPVGAKTGTTNGFTDAWFIAFTPQIVAGVWIGLDDPSLTLGEKQSGARVALPITAPFMKAAHDTLGLPIVDFERPAGIVDVEICAETKLLATDNCPDVLKEICDVRFLPQKHCDVHTGDKGNRPPAQKRLSY